MRLHQIQMAKKGNLPVYSDAGVRGADFITEVGLTKETGLSLKDYLPANCIFCQFLPYVS